MKILFGLAILFLSTTAAVAQERSLWEVILNGVEQDVIYVVSTSEGEWLPVESLTEMGLRGIGGDRRRFFDLDHVRLASLAPSMTGSFDRQELILTLTADPALLGANLLSAIETRPPDTEFLKTPSAYLNYRLLWNSDSGLAGSAESAVNIEGYSLASTGAWNTSGRFRRGFTTLTMDVVSSRVRIEIGDTVGRGLGGLAGGGIMAGISVNRDNSLDPYYQPYSVPTFSGSAILPSVAELYVNGALQRTFELMPGTFTIANLPTTSGRGAIRVRIRDQAGRVQEYAQDYYVATQLLAKGRHGFHYSVGFKREETEIRPSYKDWMYTAGHRVGVSNRITLGAFTEGDKRSQMGGLTLGVSIPVLGEVGLDVAASRASTGTLGLAASGAWQLVASPVAFSLTGQWYGRRYYGLDQPPDRRARPWNANLVMSAPIGQRLSWFLQGGIEELLEVTLPGLDGDPLAPLTVSRSTVTRLGSGIDIRPLRKVNLRVAGYWNRDVTTRREYWETTVGLAWSPGKKVSVSAEAVRDRDGEAGYVGINRPAPRGTGIGFRLRTTGPIGLENRRGQADIELQNSFARASISHERGLKGDSSTSAFLEGAFLQVGKVFAISRPVTQSFVMVRVPDGKNVTVYRDNDRVGRTGPRGHFLVPNLQAYYGNIIAIEDTDLPLDLLVDRTRAVIAPPYRGGVKLTFHTRRIRAYTGTVAVEPWSPTEARYGTLTISRGDLSFESPLGSDGSYYLENAEAGSYFATITMGSVTCETTLVLPDTQSMLTNLGALVCRVGGSGSGAL